MARQPKKPSSKLSNGLLEALSFLNCITKDEGAPYETHINLQYNTAVAYNDVLSAGIIIAEDIIAAPHNKTFKAALSKCAEAYTLSIDGTRIVVKSGKFKVNVPCIDPIILAIRNPDPPSFDIDERFKAALACIDVIKAEPNSEQIYLLAFLMNGQSVITTDGKIIIEYWHGIANLPTIAIPKTIIPAIVGINKKLVKFGYSNTSVTFFFEDKSWIKSQLYNKEWPSDTINAVLNKNCNPSAVPPDFFTGLDAVATFSEKGSVFFKRDKICSHKVEEVGATFDVPGLPNGPIYTAKYLSIIKNLATKIDFAVSANGSVHSNNSSGYLLFWFGNQVRGIIAGHG